MPTYHTKSFLVDGPIMTADKRRAAMEINMGTELLEADAFRDRGDAIRCLMNSETKWAIVDVFVLVDDARQWAFQAVVAAEMSEKS